MAKTPVKQPKGGKAVAKKPKVRVESVTFDEGEDMLELFAALAGQLETSRSTAELDEAQDIAFEAMEASTRAKRVKLARKALALSPDCADAYTVLADECDDPRDEIVLRRQAVEAGARALGEAAFTEDAGLFWGLIETRPYMRARQALAVILWERGEREEAVEHYRALLHLNPDDNQGNRYLLMDALLELGRDDEAAALLKCYKDDGTAAWDWSKALLTFRRKGDSAAARKDLSHAMATNPHVAGYLLGREPLPDESPMLIGFGDESEAVAYVHGGAAAWRVAPGALQWVAAHAGGGTKAAALPAPSAQSATDRIDDAVLALLLLGLHQGDRVWKSFDWDAMERLHAKGLISNPASQAKSVVLSDEGLRRARLLHEKLFGDEGAPGPGS